MKRAALKVAITALCLIAQTPLAEATTYYLSASGNDTNAGTSMAAPWRNLTNIYRYQFSIKPGDSILLNAGESFDGPLSMGNGGTSNAPITIDRYGTGANPIIYGDHPSITWIPVSGHPGMYSATLGVQGLINIGKVYDINGNRYGHLAQGTNALEAWLNTFTNKAWGETTAANTIYIRTIDDNPPPKMHVMEQAAVGTGGGYHIIQNLEVCNGGKGIIVSGKGDIIRNNYIHDGYQSGIFLYYASGAEVYSNTVMRTAYTQIYLFNGGANWVHHNTCSISGGSNGTPIINGTVLIPNIENCGIGIQQGTNNIIEHNSLSYYTGDFVDVYYEVDTEVRYNYGFHATMATAPMGTGLKVHHNVFHLDHAGVGISTSHAYDPVGSPLPDSGPVLIYNNVIYDFDNGGFYCRDKAPGVILRNNILVMLTTNKAFINISSPVDSDYNTFYARAGALGWVWNDTNLSSTLPIWRATSGNDSNSIYADPQFVSANPVTAADFQLKSTSPCKNIGLNLKLAGLLPPAQEYQDYFGTLIPRGFGPEIGPYEIPAPGSPTNLHPTP